MCQLLGMNCNTDGHPVFFEGFHRRGGLTDQHADGFGIAFFEGVGCWLFLDDQASAHSPVSDLIPPLPDQIEKRHRPHPQATQGRVALENTHRFTASRGAQLDFAHNGNLEHFAPARGLYYRPVGDTDSKPRSATCWKPPRQRFAEPPPLAELTAAVRELAASIRAHVCSTSCSAMATCCSPIAAPTCTGLVRQAPFPAWRTWWTTTSIDFAGSHHPSDRVAVIATTADG